MHNEVSNPRLGSGLSVRLQIGKALASLEQSSEITKMQACPLWVKIAKSIHTYSTCTLLM